MDRGISKDIRQSNAIGTLVDAWIESGLYEAPKMAEDWVKSLDELEEEVSAEFNTI